MNDLEKSYYEALVEQVTNGFVAISFDERDSEDDDNLVNQIETSPHPLVLCAFLESARYQAGADYVPFEQVTPPSLEEVEELFGEYNGKMPTVLNIFSLSEHNGLLMTWKGIQYARYYPEAKFFRCHIYTLAISECSGMLYGKGEIPVGCAGSIDRDRIVLLD